MELSEIALQKLLQLFPELSAYIVSFKDITEESGREGAGLQIGMFILQFGQEYYYVPVIAKNDTVMPIDSLFSSSTGTFSPLTKSFLDKAISSSQVYLGKSKKIPDTVPQNPSVYDMVTPPRTGKFVYASSSRLVEFLAIMPDLIKSAMVEKFSEDKEVYGTLHRLFGLENLLSALKPTGGILSAIQKPAVELVTGGTGLDNDAIKSILEKGYALRGEHTTERVAVLANDYAKLGPLSLISSADAGYDYSIVQKTGEIKDVFIPKRFKGAPRAALLRPAFHYEMSRDPVFGMFSNGDYVVSGSMVSRGEPDSSKSVAKHLFGFKEPVTPKEVGHYDSIAIFTPNLELIGAFRVRSVCETMLGVTIEADSMVPGMGTSKTTINAYRNCKTIDASMAENIFIPINTLIVKLGREISDSLEVNVNAAIAKLELSTLQALGSAIDMGFDGIEFTVDGKPVGSEMKMVEFLVGREGIAPDKAENFIKQAKDQRHVKIYLSKKADFQAGEIPQYGNAPPSQINNFGADRNGAFANNLKASAGTEDAQTVESMVISELLQATDMSSLVKEYLPEINQTIDKLGRTLFLARLNIDKLSRSQNANEVMSFIANMRNVYRLLGDNYIKLEKMVSGPEEAQEEAGQAK